MHDRDQALAVAKRIAIDFVEIRQEYLGQSARWQCSMMAGLSDSVANSG
jgi:hypothetical protein